MGILAAAISKATPRCRTDPLNPKSLAFPGVLGVPGGFLFLSRGFRWFGGFAIVAGFCLLKRYGAAGRYALRLRKVAELQCGGYERRGDEGQRRRQDERRTQARTASDADDHAVALVQRA